MSHQRAGGDGDPSESDPAAGSVACGCSVVSAGSCRQHNGVRCSGSACRIFRRVACRLAKLVYGVATAVTGPPPRSYDFRTRVIGGSRSPHGYPMPCVHISIELSLSFPRAIISKATGYQYASIQSSPIGEMRSTVQPASRIENIIESAA